MAMAIKNDFLTLYSTDGVVYTRDGRDAESHPALEKAL